MNKDPDQVPAGDRDALLRQFASRLEQDEDLKAEVADLDRRLKLGLPTDTVDGKEVFERHKRKHLGA